MTSSIKPPGGPTGPEFQPPGQGSGEPAEVSAGGFERALDGVDDAPIASAAGTNSPESIAEALRQGDINFDTAVEQLVSRVADTTGGALTEAGRVELAAFLRGALTRDPNLKALLSELGGG